MTSSSPPTSERRPPRNRALLRWLPIAVVLVLGVIVYLPAIRAPLYLDDFNQLAMVRGTYPARRGPLDLYDFVSAADRAALLERGVLPWWTDPTLHVRFLRPLSSALLWLDYRISGSAPLLPHLHSFAWWLGAVLAAHALFRRLLHTGGAVLATFIFALAPCHAVPLAWLANREALVSLTFGLLALGRYVRWREGRASTDGALAAALFVATFAAGEYSLGFTGYVLAHEIVRRDRPASRLTGLLPFAVPAAVYLLIHHRYGYGASGLGFYADPLSEPAVFLRAAPANLSALLVEGWLTVGGADAPGWALPLLAVFLSAIALGLPSRLDVAQRAAARWLLFGSILALIPMLAVAPSPRLLGASMFGIAGFTGLLVDHAWFAPPAAEQPRPGSLVKLAALAVAVVQLVLAPIAAWSLVRAFHRETLRFSARAAVLRTQLEGRTGDQILVLRSFGGGFIVPFLLDERGPTSPRFRVLSETGHVLVMRTGPRTLELAAPRGQSLFPFGPANLVRDTRHPTFAGQTFRVPGMVATILEVTPLGPRRVQFELDEDLDSAPVTAVVEELGGFRRVALPALGAGAPFAP